MNILVAILALSFLIIIHELGHFTVAKLAGIRVLEFSLFMGPKLFSFQKGETMYSFRAIPLGGYVKMEGEEEASEDERAYNKKPKWVRAAVLIAGPAANILAAILIYTVIMLFSGFGTNVVGQVLEGSAAEKAGIVEGDRIVSFDGKSVNNPMDFSLFMYGAKGREVTLEVQRGDETKEIIYMTEVLPAHDEFKLNFEARLEDGNATSIIERVLPGGVAERVGLQAGDRIIRLNGQEVKGLSDVRAFLDENRENPIDITVLRDGKEEEILGVVPAKVSVPEMFKVDIGFSGSRGGFFESLKYSVLAAYSVARNVVYSISWLLNGTVSLREMMGPVGIVSSIGEAVQQGTSLGEQLVDLFSFVAMISVNLGVFNLLPIPALDGSKILLILVEAVRRKPLAPEKEALISMVGFALLILLMIYTFYNDIVRLIT